MNSTNNIDPSKINKPIQLLGAWLVGLVLVNGSFLGAAISLESPVWARGLLIVASVINVPVFLFSIFLLQTKFRPEMQEDSYYHDYLVSKMGDPKAKLKIPKVKPEELVEAEELEERNIDWSGYKVMINPNLADYPKIKENLLSHNIPITGDFAHSISTEWIAPAIMFGRGFNKEKITRLLNAMSGTSVKYVTYGADEDELDQYNNTILIGPITKSYKEYGLPLSGLAASVSAGKLDAKQFYSDIIISFNDGYESQFNS